MELNMKSASEIYEKTSKIRKEIEQNQKNEIVTNIVSQINDELARGRYSCRVIFTSQQQYQYLISVYDVLKEIGKELERLGYIVSLRKVKDDCWLDIVWDFRP